MKVLCKLDVYKILVKHMSHDMTKPTKWVCPAKTQISLGIRPVWSVFAVRMKKAWVLSYPLSTQRRLWSDWADAQADLSLRWAHTHFVDFVMSWLILNGWNEQESMSSAGLEWPEMKLPVTKLKADSLSEFVLIQGSRLIMLCLGSIEMDHVISEPCYKEM